MFTDLQAYNIQTKTCNLLLSRKLDKQRHPNYSEEIQQCQFVHFLANISLPALHNKAYLKKVENHNCYLSILMIQLHTVLIFSPIFSQLFLESNF